MQLGRCRYDPNFAGTYLKATRVDSRSTRRPGFQRVKQSTTGTPRSPKQRLQRLQGQPGRRDGSECDHKREMNDHAAPPSPPQTPIVAIIGD
jgi:hypothetical protein